jgi:hypothetical protein
MEDRLIAWLTKNRAEPRASGSLSLTERAADYSLAHAQLYRQRTN